MLLDTIRKVRGPLRNALLVGLTVPATLAVGATPAMAAGASPNSVICDASRNYIISGYSDIFYQVGPSVALINDVPETNRLEAHAEASGTISFSMTVDAGVSAGIVVASVESKYHLNVSMSLTVSFGSAGYATVPPHSTRYIKYGVTRRKTTGTYHNYEANCSTFTTSETAYSPFSLAYKISSTP